MNYHRCAPAPLVVTGVEFRAASNTAANRGPPMASCARHHQQVSVARNLPESLPVNRPIVATRTLNTRRRKLLLRGGVRSLAQSNRLFLAKSRGQVHSLVTSECTVPTRSEPLSLIIHEPLPGPHWPANGHTGHNG